VTTLPASPASLDRAAELLAAGAVVAVPTDTVYGLAVRLGDAAAIGALLAVKHRPASLPIAVLCATTADAVGLATTWSAGAGRLAARYWPGPLTLVVGADPALAASLGAARGVGVRVPDDAICRALLARTGPLAVTSANRHGAPPATTAAAALALGAGVAAVLDGGSRRGEVSTVVDLTAPSPVLVREGALAARDVLAAFSEG
jgi:L-threonylcarbamoyladenylate synthase